MRGSLQAVVAAGVLSLASPLLSHQPASAGCLNPECSLFNPTTLTEFRDLPFASGTFTAPASDTYEFARVGIRFDGLTPSLTLKNVTLKGSGITTSISLPDIVVGANNTNIFSSFVTLNTPTTSWITTDSFLSFDIDGTGQIAKDSTITYALQYATTGNPLDFDYQFNSATGPLVPIALPGPLPIAASLGLVAFSRKLKSKIRKDN